MRRLAAFLFAAILLAASLRAEGDELQTAVEGSWLSNRLVRGVSVSSGTVQAAATVAQGGWSGRVEADAALGRARSDEANLRAGYTVNLLEQLRLEFAATQRWWRAARIGAPVATTEAELAATWTTRESWALGAVVGYDVRRQAEWAQVSLGYSQALTRLGCYLEWSFQIGTAAGRDLQPRSAVSRRDAYHYYGAEVRLPYRIGPSTTFVTAVGAAGTAGLAPEWSPQESGRHAGLWGRVGLSLDF